MADNFLNKMYWRGLDDENIYYHGDFYLGIPSVTARLNTYRLADQLIREGNASMAKKVLDHLEKVMPNKVIPYDQFSASMVALYLALNDEKKALDIANTMVKRDSKACDYYFNAGIRKHERDIQLALYEMNLIVSSLKESKVDPNKYKELVVLFDKQISKTN
jgi:hypothetical protein